MSFTKPRRQIRRTALRVWTRLLAEKIMWVFRSNQRRIPIVGHQLRRVCTTRRSPWSSVRDSWVRMRKSDRRVEEGIERIRVERNQGVRVGLNEGRSRVRRISSQESTNCSVQENELSKRERSSSNRRSSLKNLQSNHRSWALVSRQRQNSGHKFSRLGNSKKLIQCLQSCPFQVNNFYLFQSLSPS